MKKFQYIIGLTSFLLMSVAFTLSSCGGGGGDEPTPPAPTLQAININGSTTSLTVGQTLKLTASASPSTVTLPTVVWTSSNPEVATVSNNGLVTAVGAGTVTIQASAEGKTNTYQITVNSQASEDINAESISIDESATIEVGKSQQLQATVSPSNATFQTVTWESSDTSIVTINDSGLVEAVSTGTATITATVENGDKSKVHASCEVTVIKYATELTLDKSSISIEHTETAYLYATVLPSDATFKSVTFSSSNESVATIDRSGKITTVSAGTIIITATLDNGKKGTLTATCTVEIRPLTVYATDLTITPSSFTLDPDQTVQLQSTVTPSNASYKTVTWKSSNSTIASVDSNGLVTARNSGTATITATLANGSQPDIVKTATITVNEDSSGNGDGITDNGEIGEVGTN